MSKLVWLLSLAFLGATSAPAANVGVGIGDEICDGFTPTGCFYPSTVTINAGDSVVFYVYAGTLGTGAHNVVADDGSFRCAMGCDGEGGDGTPRDWTTQWSVTRTFNTPGVVHYHDEVSRATGTIIVLGTTPFDIGPGITGAWFDPLQNGHGLFVEVLSGNRLLAWWMSFDPAGTQQVWFGGVGTYTGNTATIPDVQRTIGGRWINFDPRAIVDERWGTMTLVFTDCNHGRVEFDSVSGYGSGARNLLRLTQPTGLACL